MLMIIAVLIVVGLALGSFINALVWRVREQEVETAKESSDKKYLKQLSVTKGRSMCPHCKQGLAGKDLIPILSWLSLRGKCRYCREPISVQYPLVEAATAVLFVASYLWWPFTLEGTQIVLFGLWLLLVVGFMALIVYDWHWKLLPDRIMYPLALVAAIFAFIRITSADSPITALINTILAVGVGGGIFYVLYQVSKGKWIGGGDVKLGWLLGLIVATPGRSVLLIFLASLLGTIISLPLIATSRLKRDSTIPFGPFLIIAAILVQLFGQMILQWYNRTFFPFW